ncbi:MAG: hypothetical protein AAGI69_10055 [Cyanobacteria bacterium P01_H01_bin.21]
MQLYWKDIENYGAPWSGLAICVDAQDSPKPQLRLETGATRRIKLLNQENVIFWATIAADYSGVPILKTLKPLTVGEMTIRPITSSTVEALRNLHGREKLKQWCRVFIKELKTSPSSFLYNGLWLMTGFLPKKSTKPWALGSISDPRQFGYQYLYEAHDALKPDHLSYIDWWANNGSGQLINLKMPDKSDGRLRWWRKKVRENSLPPILIWYLNCLDAYVIVDGHIRLLAAYLEDYVPEFIAIYSAHSTKVTPDPEKQEKIFQSLTHQQILKRHKPISAETLNDVLIRAFDDRPYLTPKTTAWATIRSDEAWQQEVQQFLRTVDQEDAGELLDLIIDHSTKAQ